MSSVYKGSSVSSPKPLAPPHSTSPTSIPLCRSTSPIIKTLDFLRVRGMFQPVSTAVASAAVVALVAAVACAVPSCTPRDERCAGEDNRPFVKYVGCCDPYPQYKCLPHPKAQEDPEKYWGRFCRPAIDATVEGTASLNETTNNSVPATSSTAPPVTSTTSEPRKPVAKAEPTEAQRTKKPATTKAQSEVTEGYAAPEPPSPMPAKGGNPYKGRELYVNPTFTKDVMASMESATPGAEKDNLKKMSSVASAYWLDLKWKVSLENDTTTDTAGGILRDASSRPVPPVVTFIVYDLPNRDCHAKASNGEVCCGAKKPEGNCEYLDDAATGTCDKGLSEYTNEYIDPLAVTVKEYCGKVPMVLIVEPDSLPNLVTNLDDPKCGSTATKTAYRTGITYAVKTLAAACTEATIYLDAAHGGWLGWPDNLQKFTAEIDGLGVAPFLRGFTTNVANYQPLGVKCPSSGFCLNGANADHECCDDPCGLSAEFNPGHSELNYAVSLADAMSSGISGFQPKFLIDTGRNGQSPRSSCANWCNARGAGSGLMPTTDTAAPEIVDGYMWLKTPGESDGCTRELPGGGKCPRFDSDCKSEDSIGARDDEPRAPEAGQWFDYQIKMLAENAVLE